MRAITILVLIISLGAAFAAPDALWGPNLLPNPSVEEVDAQGLPAGWSIHNDKAQAFTLTSSTEACAGARSLAVERKAGATEGNGQIISPLVKADPGWYLLAFWYRFDSPPKADPMRIMYVERRNGPNGEQRSGAPIYFYYYATEPVRNGQWQSAFLTFQLRPGDTGMLFRLDGAQVPGRLLLDALQVRKLQLPQTAPSSANAISDGYGTDRVMDPAATFGAAWKVTEGVNPRGTKIMGGVRHSESPGLYLVNYRYKQVVPGGDGVALLRLSGGGGESLESVNASDFTANGAYQDFPVIFFYPFGGGSFYTWGWSGKGTYLFDNLTLKQLCPITHQQAWSLLYDGVDPKKVLPSAPPDPTNAPVWIARGLYAELTGLYPALDACGLTYFDSPQVQLGLNTPLPALTGKKLVVLAGAPTSALDPSQQYALQRFVESGGGLIVLGGLYGYGHGGMVGSFVEDMLPVKLTGIFDLVQLPMPGTVKLANGTAIGNCAWAHQVTLRPGATVASHAGDMPMVITGKYGKGRVVAITGTVLGTPQSPYWESPAWQVEMNRLVKWASGQ